MLPGLPNHAAEAMSDEQIRQWRVGRVSEVSALTSDLAGGATNIYLWGERAIGKTFIVRLVGGELSGTSTLPVEVSTVAHLPMSWDDVRDVSAGVVLALTQKVWKDIIGRPYSELRGSLGEPPHIELNSSGRLENLVRRIYREAMASQQTYRVSQTRVAGVSLFAKGELGDGRELEATTSTVYPFEFVEFAEELINGLEAHGVNRLAILLDEANKLSLSVQQQVLSDFLDLFSSHRVSFAFVAGIQAARLEEPRVPVAFSRVEQILGLDEESSAMLLDRALKYVGIRMDDEALAVVLDYGRGHPATILRLVNRLGEDLLHGQSASVGHDWASKLVESDARMVADLRKRLWLPPEPPES